MAKDRQPGSGSGGGAPRVCTIAPDAPFLETLAHAIVSGDLPVPGGTPPGALELPRWTVLLPTRRAVRAMRDAFLKVSGGAALLLPAIRPIGDVDEDAALLASPASPAMANALSLDLPPAIGALERRLVLSELVLKWSRAAHPGSRAATPGQAALWAGDLIALMDSAETEAVDLAALKDLVGGDYAEHWRQTLDFLQILTAHWPDFLRERGLLSPYQRRDRLMRAEIERLAATPPDAPVIAAGSTGTIPATALLLETIARLPHGAVVLPGLDLALDEESWQSITAEPHPEHPQFGMKHLLDAMGLGRDDILPLGGSAVNSARTGLISEVMRPAGSTEKWRDYAGRADAAGAASALPRLTRIDAPTAQDEAETISLILRKVAGEPPRTAALVTPDRTLARRVSARLEKWNLRVDDSAGTPLALTPQGVFMELLLDTFASGFAAVPLAALLKHPLTRAGRTAGEMRSAARTLELAGLRRPFAGRGLAALSESFARTRAAHGKDDLRHAVYRRLTERDWDDAQKLIGDLEQAFAPLAEFAGNGNGGHVAAFARAHVDTATALARDETGEASLLWRGDAGEALSLFFVELLGQETAGPEIGAADYPELFAALLAGQVVRPRAPAHPRLFIWGPLEARLQRPDIVVLGGLNEESWPAIEDAGPWLSRPMLEQIGLPSPERKIGLAAHDVAQLMGAGEVYLTRAEKSDGAPTVPSRWLLRLDAILTAAGLNDEIRNDDWISWAVARDAVEPAPAVSRPKPRPPAEARPRRLSVTRIEEWIANPYAIYARHILYLQQLDPLAAAPDAAMRGTLVHDVLSAFAKAHPDRLPQDIAAELMRLARFEFDRLGAHAVIRSIWWPQLVNFARWFAGTEPERRRGVARVHSEISGELLLGATNFTLTARADRIDEREDGALAIYDYKTGGVPSKKKVAGGHAPQLPLEAAIAQARGFGPDAAGETALLRYIRVLGRGDGGIETDVGDGDPAVLAATALDKLTELVNVYADPGQEYAALRRPGFANSAQYRYDDYAHLARVAEWSLAGEAED